MALEAEFPGTLQRMDRMFQWEIDKMVDYLILKGNSSALEELLLHCTDKADMLFGYISKLNPNSDAVCRIFMKQGLSPNGLNTKTTSLLFAACFNNMEAVARTLIKHGADVNFKDSEQITPLICSVLNNNLPLTQFLYVHGASLHEKAFILGDPLRIACTQGYLPLIEFLHKKGGMGINSYAALMLFSYEDMTVVYYFLRHIDPESLYTAYTYSMRFSIPEVQSILEKAYTITTTKTLEEGIKYIQSFVIDIWYHLLPYKKEWIERVEESKRTELACYVALYEDSTMKRFRKGEIVEFSSSRLRNIMRPYGARPIRNRVVQYLVSPSSMRINYYSWSREFPLSKTTCTESMISS
jgi:hypothetical protein